MKKKVDNIQKSAYRVSIPLTTTTPRSGRRSTPKNRTFIMAAHVYHALLCMFIRDKYNKYITHERVVLQERTNERTKVDRAKNRA